MKLPPTRHRYNVKPRRSCAKVSNDLLLFLPIERASGNETLNNGGLNVHYTQYFEIKNIRVLFVTYAQTMHQFIKCEFFYRIRTVPQDTKKYAPPWENFQQCLMSFWSDLGHLYFEMNKLMDNASSVQHRRAFSQDFDYEFSRCNNRQKRPWRVQYVMKLEIVAYISQTMILAS